VTRTKTRETTRTRVATDRSFAALGLTDVEEKVVRMRHGLALAPDAALEFHEPEQGAVRAELRALEARAMAAIAKGGDAARIKAEIIDELRDL
jgi:DNA-directed RNA polymerase sigma subunit (sigma70/sigma32)